MRPRDRDEHQLPNAAVVRPKTPHDARVGIILPEKLVSETGGRDVADEEKGNRQPERKPQEFRRRHAQRMALVKRHEGKRDMHGEGGIERHAGRGAAPELQEHQACVLSGVE